jgi:outer membrane protein TolC
VFSGELRKEIIESGTTLSIGQSKTKRADREENTTELRLEQSLYKNFLGRDVRLKKSSLEDEQKIENLRMTENYDDYILKMANIYLDFKKSFFNMSLSEAIYNESKKLEKNVKEKYRSKVATRTDLHRIELLVVLKKEDFLIKKRALDIYKADIEKISGMKINEYKPKYLKKMQFKESPISLADIRSLKILELEEERLKKEEVLQGRSNDPALNLIAGYNKDDSKRFSSTVKRNETVIGLRLQIPLADTKGNAAKKIAINNYYKAQLSKKSAILDFELNQSKALLKVEELSERVKSSDLKLALTKKILKEEEKRYRYGKIELEKLIETKNEYSQYRFENQEDIIDYNKSVLAYYELADQLIEMKENLF